MIGVGKLAQDLLGPNVCVSGLACTGPVSPGLNVQIGPGQIYSPQVIDATAYSTLTADTTHTITKQGILLDAITLNCPAPSTSGQSIAYLIQAQYQDSDTASQLLPYYNSANPASPLSGQGGNGISQPTMRSGIISITAKAGIPAPTGTQGTPLPDTGYTGLWVVIVANGATTIVSGNISAVPGAPFLNLNLGSPLTSLQGVSQNLTSTTLVPTGLSLNLPVGQYALEGLLNFTGVLTGTQGIKFGGAGSFGGGGNQGLGAYCGRVNGTGVTGFWNGVQSFATIDVANNVSAILIRDSISVGTPGTFIITAAQNSASANATVFGAASYITATRIG